MASVDLPQGVDVASYQQYPDWTSMREAGYAFAFTKSTEATDYVNPYFVENWRRIKESGLYRGAYHFARPDKTGPETEAEFFVNVVEARGLDQGDLLALDIEDYDGSFGRSWVGIAEWSIRFLERTEQLVGFKPLIYVSGAVIREQYFSQYGDRFKDFGLWLASWRSTMPPPPPPWDVIAFWQDGVYGVEKVPGIQGSCDHDYFNGESSAIPLYGKRLAPPVPEPLPERFLVGAGIRDRMRDNGDVPGDNEMYVKDREGVDLFSYCHSAAGLTYIYFPRDQRVVVGS